MNRNRSESNQDQRSPLEKDFSGDEMTDAHLSDKSVGLPAHLQHLVASGITHDFESNPYIQHMQNALLNPSGSSPVSETPRPSATNFRIGKVRSSKVPKQHKSLPTHDQRNLDLLSKAVETQPSQLPSPSSQPHKSAFSVVHHGLDPANSPLSHPSSDFPPEKRTELRSVQTMLIAFKQTPTPPETDQIARIFAKMDLAYETNSRRVTASTLASLTQPKSQPPVAACFSKKEPPKPTLPPRSFASMSNAELPTFHFDAACVQKNRASPKTDARLYFAHCYNWLESITGFCQTAAMKSHLTKLLEIMSAHCSDGIFIRDSSFRTLWISTTFCDRMEFEKAELMSPTSTPFDYTDAASLLPLHMPFVRAMFDKNCLTTNFMLRYITKHTKKVLPAFTKYWFFRNESGDLHFMATTITFCIV